MIPQALAAYLDTWRPLVDQTLSGILDEVERRLRCTPLLVEAMRHALLGGGKRLRPILVLAAARALSHDERGCLEAAAALELIHAYSLVHDDLPAMDDDDLRRGRPTCHRAFGEAMAILAGDALLTQAFAVLARAVPAERAAQAMALVAEGAGPLGMVGGQADDIQPVVAEPSAAQVEGIHLQKTAALFEAAVGLGALVVESTAEEQACLMRYARALGLAFQIADDLLDAAGAAAVLGKPGSDSHNDRRTHPRAVGVVASRARVQQLLAEARKALVDFGPGADILLCLVGLVENRAGISS